MVVLTTVQRYHATLGLPGRRATRRSLATTDLAGSQPSWRHTGHCTAPGQRVFVAGVFDQPAPRLDALVAAFEFRSDVTPLREPSLDLYIPMFGGGGHWGVPCLEGGLGPDPECSISDVMVEDEVAVHERLIPRCDGRQSVKPCWHIETNLQSCPAWLGSESKVLEIERHDYAPRGTHVRGNCVSRSGENP